MAFSSSFFQFTDITLFLSAFLLVFAVVFALLSYSGIFGRKEQGEKPDRRLLAIISVAIALASAAYEPFLAFLQNGLPIITIALIVLFFIVFIYKIFTAGGDEKKPKDPWPAMVALVLLLIGATVSWDYFRPVLMSIIPGVSAESIIAVIAVVVVIAIFILAYRMTDKNKGATD